jgi:hypothetical protein
LFYPNRLSGITKLKKDAPSAMAKIWLGGLDSNQDSQIQSLESYQLDDLPAEGGIKRNRGSSGCPGSHDSTFLI